MADPPAPPPQAIVQVVGVAAGDASAQAHAARAMFSPRRLTLDLWVDALLRWSVVLLVIGAMSYALLTQAEGSMLGLLAVVLVILAWMAVNLTSVRVSRDLPQLGLLLAKDPDAAEQRIMQHLARRPLVGWIRLTLYHRLASVRHRQQRHDQVLAICQAVLRHRLGPAREARVHLLLMLSEAAMTRGRLDLAYGALAELHRLRMTLGEAMQRMALQTRYEVMAGHHADTLRRSEQKVQLAELMPAAQCGAVHAMLATAATQQQRLDLARWLWDRAELLCTADQLKRLTEGGFAGEEVRSPEVEKFSDVEETQLLNF